MKFCVLRPAAVETIVPELNQNSAPKVAGLKDRNLIVGGNVGGVARSLVTNLNGHLTKKSPLVLRD